jgi:hypothetical protein
MDFHSFVSYSPYEIQYLSESISKMKAEILEEKNNLSDDNTDVIVISLITRSGAENRLLFCK